MLTNHAFTFAFSIDSTDPTGLHIPAPQLRTAILKALARIGDDELLENLGAPFDSYPLEP